MKPIMIILLILAAISALTFGLASKGNIVIRESFNGKSFDIKFTNWSSQDKCEILLGKNESLQIELACDSGEISLDIYGEGGYKAYKGSKLQQEVFIVTVSQAGTYIIDLAGNKVTGRLLLQRKSSHNSFLAVATTAN